HQTLRQRRSVPLLLPTGTLRTRVGGQGSRQRWTEDRQRPPALGLWRSRLPVPALQSTRQGLEAKATEETRGRQGAGHPGGSIGSSGLPPVAQGRGLRRNAFLAEQASGGQKMRHGEKDLTGSSSLLCFREVAHATAG